MREELIKALSFPRSLIKDEIDMENCSHAGQYDLRDALCHHCENQNECSWLVSNDEFVALEKKPTADLIEALNMAVLFVEAQIAKWEHKYSTCACAVCSWSRDAQDLLSKLDPASS